MTSGPPALPGRETARGPQHGGKARNAAKTPKALPCKARVIRQRPDCLNPSLQWWKGAHPPAWRLRPGPPASDDSGFRRLNPPGRWATGSEPVQGDGQGCLRHARYVQRKGNSGWPTGREPYGHGVSVVAAGVTTCQGGRESRLHGRRDTGAQDQHDGEVREMRDAATVLEIIRERGRKGLPLERVYRCLFNPDLYLLAFFRINFCPFSACFWVFGGSGA